MRADEDQPQARIDAAIVRVVQDKVGHFDECLVDRLFGSIANLRCHSRKISEGKREWKHTYIELYEDLDSINLARLLRYHSCISDSKQPCLDSEIVKSFSKKLPTIILRQNAPETTAALSFLLNLLDFQNPLGSRPSRPHLMDIIKSERYDAPFDIKNVIDLINYCLSTSKVYQIQDLAKKILICFVLECSMRKDPILFESIRRAMRQQLLEKKSPLVYQFVNELFRQPICHLRHSEMIEVLESLVKQAFDDSFNTPGATNLVALSRCMASVGVPRGDVVGRLESKNNLDAILMYVTNRDIFNESFLMYFIFYPILSRCRTEDAQVLTGQLIVTRQEKLFIDRNLKDKHVIQCLTYLHQVVSKSCPTIKTKWKLYILDVALEYFKCNYSKAQGHKDLVLSCLIMNGFENLLPSRTTARSTWLSVLVDVLHDIIEKIDYNSYRLTIFLQLLKLLENSQIGLNDFKTAREKFKSNFVWTTELAFKYDDPEVLNAFAQYFLRVESENFLLIPRQLESERYLQLIWKHMLPIAKSTNHSELIGNSASVLIFIDARLPQSTLDNFGLKKHADIPRAIGDILLENRHVYTIAEHVSTTVCNFSGMDVERNRTKKDYIEYIDNHGRSDEAKLGIDHFVKGMCESLRGESSDTEKFMMLMMTSQVASTAYYECRTNPASAGRLARMGMLDILYDIYHCPLYKYELKDDAVKHICSIGKHVTMSSDELEKFIAPYTDRAKELAEFFTRSEFKRKSDHFFTPYPKHNGTPNDEKNQIGLASYLDDILDTERISEWGITECY